MTAIAPTIQAFFTDYLVAQRQLSPNTVRAYRDLLGRAEEYFVQRAELPSPRRGPYLQV